MFKIRHFIEQSWLLIVSSFCFGVLIAITNAAWSPKIVQNEKNQLEELQKSLIAAKSFEAAIEGMEITDEKGRTIKTDIYKGLDANGTTVGFTFIATGAGFADKIWLVIAVDSKCEKFLGYKVLSSNETPGFGDKIKEDYLGNQFKGTPVGKIELIKTGEAGTIDSEIVAISGATVSSEAVVKIFNAYIDKVTEQLRTKGLIGNGR